MRQSIPEVSYEWSRFEGRELFLGRGGWQQCADLCVSFFPRCVPWQPCCQVAAPVPHYTLFQIAEAGAVQHMEKMSW